jgi:hypothetical protein
MERPAPLFVSPEGIRNVNAHLPARHQDMGSAFHHVNAGKQKAPKIVYKKSKPRHLAKQRKAIGTSNNFVNQKPRKTRHRKAADIPRQSHTRETLYLIFLILLNHTFRAQFEIILRTSIYKHRNNSFIFEPPRKDETNAPVIKPQMPTGPAEHSIQASSPGRLGASQRFMYANVAGQNVTFARDRIDPERLSQIAARIRDGHHRNYSSALLAGQRAIAAPESEVAADAMANELIPQQDSIESALIQSTHSFNVDKDILLQLGSLFSEYLTGTDHPPSAWLPANSSMLQQDSADSALAQSANWLAVAGEALSRVRSYISEYLGDRDHQPSAWPLPGGLAAPAGRTEVARQQQSARHGQGNGHGHRHGHRHEQGHGQGHTEDPSCRLVSQQNSETAPQTLLNQIMGNIVTREELGKFLMKMKGVDPYALFNHTRRPFFASAEKEQKPGIHLYIHSQKTEWLVRNYYSPEIEALPPLDDIFFNMIDSLIIQAQENITCALGRAARRTGYPSHGRGGTYTLKTIRVQEFISRERTLIDTTSIGYILDVDDHDLGRHEAFVIAPAHHPPLIRIPLDETGQKSWLHRHLHLFFNTNNKSKNRPWKVTTDTSKQYTNIYSAINDAAKNLASNIVNAFKDEAFGETDRERLVNYLQWHVPFYAAWIAYKRHEYTEAVVRTVLDVITLAGGPLARGLKSAGIILKSGRLVNLSKHVKKIGFLDVPAQVDNLKAKIITTAGGRIGGPAGKMFSGYLADEMNQTPNLNSLNQAVDLANAHKTDNRNQIKAVVENT